MQVAEHRIAGDAAQPQGDLAGREPVGPELTENADP
jgi:hypothetical protein